MAGGAAEMRAGRESPESGPCVRQKAPPAAECPRLASRVVTWPPPEGPTGGHAAVTVWAFSVVLTKAPRFLLTPGPHLAQNVPWGGASIPRPRTGLGSMWDPWKCTSLALPAVVWIGDTARGRGAHRLGEA